MSGGTRLWRISPVQCQQSQEHRRDAYATKEQEGKKEHMKHHARIAVAAMLLLALATLAGCQGASQRWGALTITYTKALSGASDLRRQGFIDDDAYRDIEAVRAPISLALDAAHEQIVRGDDDAAGDTLDRAADLLDTLSTLLAQQKGPSP